MYTFCTGWYIYQIFIKNKNVWISVKSYNMSVDWKHQASQCDDNKWEMILYSLPSVGPGSDTGVQAVIQQVSKPSTWW